MYQNGFTRAKVMEVIREKNQGYMSQTQNGTCLYRSHSNGETNACLVGCFIPDSKYEEGMESVSAEEIIENYNLEKHMPMNTNEMERFQNFHDNQLKKHHGKVFYSAVEDYLIDLEKTYKRLRA